MRRRINNFRKKQEQKEKGYLGTVKSSSEDRRYMADKVVNIQMGVIVGYALTPSNYN